ncbi:dihydrodipicolinate synthase family protein [Rhizobium sp. P44RR-XXIV]|uniref:dihydrodipicolinate synthase family protein n=1 Tax=Rhizobium sp. P44RR-XXIV TaxID=1921145 RepID=UPI00098742A8|nr:dihydrodipicolinate synthase family protein [Rhizobium sp. P44RR-XXIV]TIX90364.1 dihydrodipicolinate synthase family protein [Rhizobium sp. P44RR-XXIV]
MTFEPEKLHGIHAILYAFFDGDEKLDRAAMKRQTDICIAQGVHGLAALGLATEVSKLAGNERRIVMDWLAEDNAGRLPLAFTIFGTSVAEQIEQVRHAERAGADWVILQPPPVGSFGAKEYIDFFGRVADATALPVAIQNAPAFLGRGLTGPDLAALRNAHPNVRVLKAEGSAVEVKALMDAVGGDVPVFNGRGGLELLDGLRAGCAGYILAPDLIDYAVRAYNAFHVDDESRAEEVYRAMLPSAVTVMQGIEHLMCYGKRLFAERAGLVVHDRAPAMRPTEFGQSLIAQHARALGMLQIR